MARVYRYISVDSHLELSPDKWAHWVPEKYRDRAPRRVKLADGGDAIMVEGRPIFYGGTDLFAGKAPEEFSPTGMDFDGSAGTGPPEQRLREQDADGIDAEVLFPGGTSGTGQTKAIRDKNAYLAVNRAWNDHLGEEYCAFAPDRLLGVGVLPQTGVEDAIAEMQHCARMGLKTVVLGTYPSGKSFPSPEDDRFWAAALEMGMPLTIHTSFGLHYGGREDVLFKYPVQPEGELRPPTDYLGRFVRHGIPHSGAVEAVQMVLAGVFERFPKLKIYWAENNIGWIPYYYEQIDSTYQKHHHWAERHMGVKPLARLPSEYLRDQAYWGFFDDPFGLRMRHEVGVDRIMWSNDFPHVVTYWPRSLEVMETQMAGIPEEEKRKMVVENAIEFFHLDHEMAGG